jgi:hypothetical protein
MTLFHAPFFVPYLCSGFKNPRLNLKTKQDDKKERKGVVSHQKQTWYQDGTLLHELCLQGGDGTKEHPYLCTGQAEAPPVPHVP